MKHKNTRVCTHGVVFPFLYWRGISAGTLARMLFGLILLPVRAIVSLTVGFLFVPLVSKTLVGLDLLDELLVLALPALHINTTAVCPIRLFVRDIIVVFAILLVLLGAINSTNTVGMALLGEKLLFSILEGDTLSKRTKTFEVTMAVYLVLGARNFLPNPTGMLVVIAVTKSNPVELMTRGDVAPLLDLLDLLVKLGEVL